MSRIQTLIVLLIAVTIVGLVACSSKSNDTNAPTISDSTTSADPEDDRPGEGIAVGEPAPGFSPVSMPLRKLTFSVQTPNNTPENAPVYLSIVDLIGGVDKHIRMKNLGNGVYETQAEVTEGAMVRYNYDRFDGEGCCDAYVTREAIGQIFEMQYRLLLVEQDLDRVDDTIATWADLRVSHDEGTITGQVLDLETGEPVFDADVSISGIHVGTRVDGSFRVEGLPPGNHRVVVHSDTGDFLPQQAFISFGPATKEVRGDFLIEKTPLVPVTFDVQLPDSTPDDAWIKLAGNISSLGARIAHPSRPLIPDNFFIPRIERNGNTASAEFMLPECSFIEYFYAIGPLGLTQDRC
ncbi:MAG: hypothetical protein H8D69_01305 [Chloroflexi bacterium]|nr:hypothetical protein [Chloroflexota bacterium]